ELASHGVVFATFSLMEGTNGNVSVQVDSAIHNFAGGRVTNGRGEVEAWFDESWTWSQDRAHAKITAGKSATICIATMPLAASVSSPLEKAGYASHRKHCIDIWTHLLNAGMRVE